MSNAYFKLLSMPFGNHKKSKAEIKPPCLNYFLLHFSVQAEQLPPHFEIILSFLAFLTARITKRATITKIIILGISIFALR